MYNNRWDTRAALLHKQPKRTDIPDTHTRFQKGSKVFSHDGGY